jgi:hypothetical protein
VPEADQVQRLAAGQQHPVDRGVKRRRLRSNAGERRELLCGDVGPRTSTEMNSARAPPGAPATDGPTNAGSATI